MNFYNNRQVSKRKTISLACMPHVFMDDIQEKQVQLEMMTFGFRPKHYLQMKEEKLREIDRDDQEKYMQTG